MSSNNSSSLEIQANEVGSKFEALCEQLRSKKNGKSLIDRIRRRSGSGGSAKTGVRLREANNNEGERGNA